MEFSNLPEFNKEFKKLITKYRSLEDDLEVLKKVLKAYPQGLPQRIIRIGGLGIETEIFKVKHFRCKALKQKGSRSGIRVVYAYFKEEEKIEFVEIYYKEKDDKDCDKERIFRCYP